MAGDRKRIHTLKASFNEESEISFAGEKNETVCGLIKSFLAELPDPICTYYLGMLRTRRILFQFSCIAEEFLFVPKMDEDIRLETLKEKIEELPPENATCLEFVVQFLLYVLSSLDCYFSFFLGK